MLSRTLLRAPISSRVFTNSLKLSYRYQSTAINNKLNTKSLPSTHSNGPVTLKFTEDHEWIAAHPDHTAFIGITPYASDAIGDVTYVELPEVGDQIEEGDIIGSIESVKSSNDIFAPVAGEVIAINESLSDNAPLINEDPLGDGWIVQIKIDENTDFAELKSEEEYEGFLKEEE